MFVSVKNESQIFSWRESHLTVEQRSSTCFLRIGWRLIVNRLGWFLIGGKSPCRATRSFLLKEFATVIRWKIVTRKRWKNVFESSVKNDDVENCASVRTELISIWWFRGIFWQMSFSKVNFSRDSLRKKTRTYWQMADFHLKCHWCRSHWPRQ